ncbi:MAG: GlsB/YeaQ/YmgE family stress response membrane protein [Firmicutes bacterium]|nr:GlsB/YeaQ/YmgE family stress response membrane protein [Bacillota bacterium]
MLIQILVSLVVGGICGWIASQIMHSKGGLLRNVVIGVVGGALGGWLGNLIGLGDGWISSLIIAIGGPCLLIWLINKLAK